MRFARRAVPAAAAALVGLLVLPVPAHADDPALPDLTMVEGTALGSDAPAVTTGRYVDKVRADGDPNIYLVERTVPGSTILFGATLLREEGYQRSNRLAVVMAYGDDSVGGDGIVRCGSSGSFDQVSPGSLPVSTAVGFTFANRECATRDDLFLTVRAATTAKIPVGTAYELDVWEIPPVTNSDRLPAAGSAAASSDEVVPAAPTTRVQPGAWSAAAARLEPDRTTYVDLPLGKLAWFSVDVPFNNALDAIATVADPDGTSQGSSVELRILSPVGGIVGTPSFEPDAVLKETATLGTSPVSVESVTSLVNPRSRAEGRKQSLYAEAALGSQPGVYAIAVYVPNTTGEPGATLPMTLTAGLRRGTGQFAEGDDAPAYDVAPPAFPAPDGPEPSAFDPDQDARAGSDEAESPAAADDDDGDDGGDGLAYGLTGGAALLVLVGAGVMLRGRRSR